VWLVLDGIDRLPNQDKTDLCKVIADMISDDELRMSILEKYCKGCGKELYDNETCHCQNDE
jgi:hypothetical protein